MKEETRGGIPERDLVPMKKEDVTNQEGSNVTILSGTGNPDVSGITVVAREKIVIITGIVDLDTINVDLPHMEENHLTKVMRVVIATEGTIMGEHSRILRNTSPRKIRENRDLETYKFI